MSMPMYMHLPIRNKNYTEAYVYIPTYISRLLQYIRIRTYLHACMYVGTINNEDYIVKQLCPDLA